MSGGSEADLGTINDDDGMEHAREQCLGVPTDTLR